MKKLLCLCFCLALILVFAPAPEAKALTGYDSVSITITPPVAGNQPSYSPSLSDGIKTGNFAPYPSNVFENGVIWFIGTYSAGTPMKKTDRFESNKDYTVAIQVQPQDSGYYFDFYEDDEESHVTINGHPAGFRKLSSDEIEVYYTFQFHAPDFTADLQDVSVQPTYYAEFTYQLDQNVPESEVAWEYRTSSSASWQPGLPSGWNFQHYGTSGKCYNSSVPLSFNGYQFRVTVGSVSSRIATLTVAQTKAPEIYYSSDLETEKTVSEGANVQWPSARYDNFDNTSVITWYYCTKNGPWQECPTSTFKNNSVFSMGLIGMSFTATLEMDGYQFYAKATNSAGSSNTKTFTLHVQSAKPTITTQPNNVTVKEGYQARFSVTATNAESYQWYYRTSSSGSWTTVKVNGTSATYTLTTEARHNGYQFRCLVKNSAGSVYSSIVSLTVTPCVHTVAVTIPAPVAGAAASYTPSVPSGANYSYDSSDNGTYSKNGVWWRDNTGEFDMDVATASFMQGHEYRVRIYLVPKSGYAFSDSVTGTVNGNAATIRLPNDEENWVRLEYSFPAATAAKPTIATQPTNVTVNAGATATFKVVASGATSYQWYYRKTSTSAWCDVKNNGTSATYNLATIASHNGYQFRCLVKNSAGSVYTNTVTLTVKSKPTITTQPTNVTVNVGATATFKVVASGATSYQWYYRKTSTSAWCDVKNNGTSATYNLATIASHNGYQFRCLVKNGVGSVYTNTVTLTVKSKPTITTQPANVTVNVGATATFKVVASSATSYQWYYRKTSSSAWCDVKNNGTSATYNLTTIASHNGYQFRCLVKNSAGSVYTNTVTLTVKSKPTITTQPTNVTVNVGATATFKVVASGATSYQWYYRKTSSSAWCDVKNNGTSATYNLATIASHNGYQFRCLVKNSMGSVYTNTVTLTVKSKPTITTQPANVTVNVGATATLKVVASGATSYQWYYRKTSTSAWCDVKNNGTSATYNLATIASHNGYQFRCLVKNSTGSVYTNTVTLTVKSKPTITTQPTNVTVNVGATATFKVVASGATSYQWWYRKTASSSWITVKNNGTSATYQLVTAAYNNGYQFRCEAKNSLGSVFTNTVTLTVK